RSLGPPPHAPAEPRDHISKLLAASKAVMFPRCSSPSIAREQISDANETVRIIIGPSVDTLNDGSSARQSRNSMPIDDPAALGLFASPSKRIKIEQFHENLISGKSIAETAANITRWSSTRASKFENITKHIISTTKPPYNIVAKIDLWNLALEAMDVASTGMVNPYADDAIWNAFAIPVLGKQDFKAVEDELPEIRQLAVDHFSAEVLKMTQQIQSVQDAEALLLIIPSYPMAAKILSHLAQPIFTFLDNTKGSTDITIIQSFFLVALLQPLEENVPLIEGLLADDLDLRSRIDTETASTALEIASHAGRAGCARVILDSLSDKINAEGLIAASIPVCSRGMDFILAAIELFVMDKCEALQNAADERNDLPKVLIGAVTDEEPKQTSSPPPNNAIDRIKHLKESLTFISLSSYLLLYLAACGGHAKVSTVTELLDFYKDPCGPFLEGVVSPGAHEALVKELFERCCMLNHTSIVEVLLDSSWCSDIKGPLLEAVGAGHQVMVHTLLESLLDPDLTLMGSPGVGGPGTIPKVFRENSDALQVLPLIAERFPDEAKWFLAEISCVPIPGCVPQRKLHDADIRRKPIRGVKLGTSTLKGATLKSRSRQMWGRLDLEGPLTKSSAKGDQTKEIESVICMAPAALLTLDGIHRQTWSLSSWMSKPTSPLIRLLECDFGEARKRYDAGLSTTEPAFTGQAFAVLSIAFAIFFLLQEAREFIANPIEYVTSHTNLLDTGIHASVIICAVRGAFLELDVPPLLMSLVLILCGLRSILDLRIVPSIGPLVRLWVIAAIHLFPIFIPYIILAASFVGGFYLLESASAATSASGVAPHFADVTLSIQSVLSMITGDYSVVDHGSEGQIFTLKILFHLVFLIFLANIIIALMTTNIYQQDHTNTTGQWLVEVAGLMSELELYWPFPLRYSVINKITDTQSTSTDLKSIAALQPRYRASAVLTDKPSVGLDDTTDHFSGWKCKGVILYTWPLSAVSKTRWYTIPGNGTDADLTVSYQRRRSSVIVAKAKEELQPRRQSPYFTNNDNGGRNRWWTPNLDSSEDTSDNKMQLEGKRKNNADILATGFMTALLPTAGSYNALSNVASNLDVAMPITGKRSTLEVGIAAAPQDSVGESDVQRDVAVKLNNASGNDGRNPKMAAWDSTELIKVAERRLSRIQVDAPRLVAGEGDGKLCNFDAAAAPSSRCASVVDLNRGGIAGSYPQLNERSNIFMPEQPQPSTVPAGVSINDFSVVLEQMIKVEFRSQRDRIKRMQEEHARSMGLSMQVLNQLRDEIRRLGETLAPGVTASGPALAPNEVDTIDVVDDSTPPRAVESSRESIRECIPQSIRGSTPSLLADMFKLRHNSAGRVRPE
ncbi:hypothetical protein SeMB42_g03937, partial [Synchytrium endobioticum]